MSVFLTEFLKKVINLLVNGCTASANAVQAARQGSLNDSAVRYPC
jgi:hypothetical protein